MTAWRVVEAEMVRARIASRWLGIDAAPTHLGTVTLREHQRDAASRLRIAMTRFGGALLADEVGLGKTYTALAAAREARALLIVAPASLRAMWQRAVADVRISADFVSFEALSRAERREAEPASERDVVIVDEAHHARNPSTRRYARLARLTARARVLLLSATPVHNAGGDLHALLALFLGSRAARMTASDLGACVVRRTRRDVASSGTPTRAPPEWLEVRATPTVLDALLAIPGACPPRAGGGADALITLGLVRAWSSTDAALRALLRRRLSRAESLADALAHGRHPSRSELRAWVVGEDATQLAFPELVTSDPGTPDTSPLLAAVRAHADGVRSAVATLAACGDCADDSRRDLIRDIRRRHGDRPIVVFSQYAESVHAMFRRLAPDGGVAAVTAASARVAGGAITREEALARFAPHALGARTPPRAEAVTLLLATDLLSEGLNLQDAGVVVHLDLPWTPARLHQRLGRVWRIGSPHAHVFEYALGPPAPAERAVRLIARLQRKASAAFLTVGNALPPLIRPSRRPSDGGLALDPEFPRDRPGAVEAIRRTLRAWVAWSEDDVRQDERLPETPPPNVACPIVAAVDADVEGWLALVSTDHGAQLIAGRSGRGGGTDPVHLVSLVTAAEGRGREPHARAIACAMNELREFLAVTRAATDAGLVEVGSRLHARVADRIAALVAAAPAHARARLSQLAASARASLASLHTAGGEHALARLLESYPDAAHGGAPNGSAESWLCELVESGSPRSVSVPTVSRGAADASSSIEAVLLLVSRGGE